MTRELPGDATDVGAAVVARMAKLSSTQRALLERMRPNAPVDDGARPAHEPVTAVQRELIAIWRDVLRADQIGVHDSFFALGGDSITSLQVAARAAAVGLRITPRQVLDEETIARLAAVAGRAVAPSKAPVPPTGKGVLTPIQHWFFEQDLPDSHHWNQMVFVAVTPGTDSTLVAGALQAVIARHDMLRSRFRRVKGQWRYEVSDAAPPNGFHVVDLRDLDDETRDTAIEAGTEEAQRQLSLADGSLVGTVLFRLAPPLPDRLLIAIHHLAVDGVSMRIFIEDLERVYRQLAGGIDVNLPLGTDSYLAWSAALGRQARRPEVVGQLDYWRSVPAAGAVDSALGLLPTVPGGVRANTVSRSRTAAIEVDTPIVVALRGDVIRRSGARLRDVLLAAFALTWRARTGHREVQVDLEGHGREPLAEAMDVTRTVGWFTSIFPVRLVLFEQSGVATAVDAVRRNLNRIPDNGLGYGLLRYVGDDAGRVLADLPQSEISFNYLGWFEPPAGPNPVFGVPVQAPGVSQSSRAVRRYRLDLVITGVGDRLLIELTYGVDHHRTEDVQTFLAGYLDTLRELAAGPDLDVITRQINIRR